MRHTMTRLHGGAIAVVILLPSLVLSVPLFAQAEPTDTTAIDMPYRAPQLALSAPVRGEALPQDKPSVVFRYAQREPDDPLDLASLVVLVDGEDRSAQFHTDSTEAWGSIDPLTRGASAGQALALGVHQLAARICSTRGICADLREAVTIAPSTLDVVFTPPSKRSSRFLAAIALILAFIQRLITL